MFLINHTLVSIIGGGTEIKGEGGPENSEHFYS